MPPGNSERKIRALVAASLLACLGIVAGRVAAPGGGGVASVGALPRGAAALAARDANSAHPLAVAGDYGDTGAGVSGVTTEGSDLAVDARLGGSPVAVAAEGDRVLLATQSQLEVFESRADGGLSAVGRPVALPAFARTLALAGDEAYVGTSDGSVIAVDVSDPLALAVEGVLDLPIGSSGGSVAAMVVVDATLYATTEDRQFHTIDITARGAPALVGSARAGPSGTSLAVRDGIAYVVDPWGLSIFDLTDRLHPVQLSRVDRPEFDPAGDGRALALVGDRAYVGTPRDLRIIDVGDPRRARQVASVPVGADRLTVVGDTLYALDLFYGENGGLQRAFLHSMALGQGEPPAPVQRLEISSGPPAEAQAGGRWYLADDEVGLRTLVLDGPEGPSVGERVPPEHVALVAADGETVALAVRLPAGRWNDPTARDRWRIDLAIPAAGVGPAVAGSWEVPDAEGDVVAVAVVGSQALVLTGAILGSDERVLAPGFLHVLDVGAPQAPVEAAPGVLIGSAWSLHADGDWVLVGTADGVVRVFAWTSGGALTERSTYAAGAGVIDVARHGAHALLATGEALEVVDLSDPATPRRVTVSGTELATGHVVRLAVIGDRLWAVLSRDVSIFTENVLAVFDIATIAMPRQLWRGDTYYYPDEIAPGLEGELFLWGARGNYLCALDASGDGEPRQLYVLAPPAGDFRDVTVVGQHVHLAAGDGGYMRLSPSDPATRPPTRTPVPAVASPTGPASTPGPTHTPDPARPNAVFLPAAQKPALPAPELALEVLYRGGGPAGALTTEGDRAYMVSGGRLVVLDIGQPAHPALLGEVDFPSEVALRRRTSVYLLQPSAGIVRALVAPMDPLGSFYPGDTSFLVDFDCTDPHAPRTVAVTAVPGHAVTMATIGRTVYVPVLRVSPEDEQWIGIVVVDAPPSGPPSVVAEIETDTMPLRLHAVTDRLLAVGVDLGGRLGTDYVTPERMLLYDVSDPLRPVEMARAEIGNLGTNGWPVLLRPLPSGEVLLLGYQGVGRAFPCCEAADLARAVPVDIAAVLAREASSSFEVADAHLAGSDLILVGDPGVGALLAVLDLAEVSAPALRAISVVSEISGRDTGPTDWTAVAGDRLVLSGLASGGARIVDLADGELGRTVGAWVVPGGIGDLSVAGHDLYTASGRFEHWDFTSPALPERISSVPAISPWGDGSFVVSGPRAYVVGHGWTSSALQVVRLDGPGAPEPLATIEPIQGRPVPDGDRLYVADEAAGLHVFALATAEPSGLRRLALIPPVGRSLNVAISDGHAFVASEARGLSILDVTDASAWREVASLHLPGQTLDVAVWGSRAHVLVADPDRDAWWADPSRGRLYTIDVSTPGAPRIVGARTWPHVSAGYWRQHGSRLLVLGTLWYGGSAPCTVVELSSGRPRVVGTLPGQWFAVDGSDDLIYAVNDAGELVVGRMR